MSSQAPSSSQLPAGASRWATPKEVAKRTGHDVRSVRDWCANRILVSLMPGEGYSDFWIAVDDECWPIEDSAGLSAYRKRRSASAAIGGSKGWRASMAARRAKEAARS